MGELDRVLQRRLAAVEGGPGAAQKQVESFNTLLPNRLAQPNQSPFQQALSRELAQSCHVSIPETVPGITQPAPAETLIGQQTQQPFPQQMQAQVHVQTLQYQLQQPVQRVRVNPPRVMNGIQSMQFSGSASPPAAMGSKSSLSSRNHPGLCGQPAHQIGRLVSREVSSVDLSNDGPVPKIRLPVPGTDGRLSRHTIHGYNPGQSQQTLANGEATAMSHNGSSSTQLFDEVSQLRSKNKILMEENHHLLENARHQESEYQKVLKSCEDGAKQEFIRFQTRMERLEQQNAAFLQQHREKCSLEIRNVFLEQNLELSGLREMCIKQNQKMCASAARHHETSFILSDKDSQETALRKEMQELESTEAALRKDHLELLNKAKLTEDSLESTHRENEDAKNEVNRLQEELSRRTAEIKDMRETNAALDRERARLTDERKHSEEQGWRWAEESAGAGAGTGEASAHRPSGPACSESSLRAAMTEQMVSAERLKQAIGGVEALLGEARRELATKQLRERRAAHEQLGAALQAGTEEELIKALEFARKAELDEVDLSAAQAKLLELQSESPEVKEARAARSLENDRKRDAFQCVKKKDRAGLAHCIGNPDESRNWKEWRDYMGRDLWKFALEMRADDVQEYLRPLMGLATSRSETSNGVGLALSNSFEPELLSAKPAALESVDEDTTSEATLAPTDLESRSLEEADSADPPLPALSERETEDVKKEAFRFVVQDNTTGLSSALDRLPREIWSAWENKIGKTLLTLSEERGSSNAYSLLAKRLGLTQDRKIETFEYGETVWVYPVGDVQPKRATVREDSPEEEEEVLLEYWDGDDPASKVDKSMVLKVCSS